MRFATLCRIFSIIRSFHYYYYYYQTNFQKYNDFTVKQLKEELAKLKHQGSVLPDIKYVSGLLRSKLKTTPSVSNKQPATDKYDYHIGRNFWNFVKNTPEKRSSIMPSFSRDHCTRFLIHLFSATTPHKIFNALAGFHFCLILQFLSTNLLHLMKKLLM